MRLYTYAFHGVVALVMIVIALVSWFSGAHNLDLVLLPWQDETLRWVLLAFGSAGLLIVWLASRDMAPLLFLVWSAVVFLGLVRGFFLTWIYYLRGPYELSWALALSLAALVALACAWFLYRRPKAAGY